MPLLSASLILFLYLVNSHLIVEDVGLHLFCLLLSDLLSHFEDSAYFILLFLVFNVDSTPDVAQVHLDCI